MVVMKSTIIRFVSSFRFFTLFLLFSCLFADYGSHNLVALSFKNKALTPSFTRQKPSPSLLFPDKTGRFFDHFLSHPYYVETPLILVRLNPSHPNRSFSWPKGVLVWYMGFSFFPHFQLLVPDV